MRFLAYCNLFPSEISKYSQQQSKWYPQRCLHAHFEATFDFSEFTSKFATAKIECSLKMDK